LVGTLARDPSSLADPLRTARDLAHRLVRARLERRPGAPWPHEEPRDGRLERCVHRDAHAPRDTRAWPTKARAGARVPRRVVRVGLLVRVPMPEQARMRARRRTRRSPEDLTGVRAVIVEGSLLLVPI